MTPDRQATRRLRVAVLIDVVAHYRVELFNALAARGDLEIKVFSCAPRESGLALVPVGAATFEHELVTNLRWRSRATGRLRFVAVGAIRRIVAWRPDVVVAGMTTLLAVAGLAAARLARVPFVWWVDVTARVDALLSRRALVPVKRALARRASVSLASSRAAREYLLALGAPAGRIVVAPIAIDTRAYAERVDEAGAAAAELRRQLDVRPPVVLFCGRLERHKGVLELIDAFAAAGPAAAGGTLLLVGDGALADELRRRAARLGVRLVLAGLRQPADLHPCFAVADAFCLLSEYDCFAVVVAEAAAAGLPLVISRHAGAADHLVEDGVNGWVVDPADTAGVGARLGRLFAEPERRRAMGAASRRIALANGMEPTVAAFVSAVAAASRREPAPRRDG